MNQPVFLPIIVYLYSKITRSRYIIDSHSGLFNKIWRYFIPIMKIVYKSCLINIAHNEHDANIYRSWGVKTVILGTEVYPYESYKVIDLGTLNNVAVIGTYAQDEPIHEILLAAEGLKRVNFYITGAIENAKKVLNIKKISNNVILTDFLPREKFIGLVKAADVAMVLVTTDNTMQMGAWEALSCETPLILSDWPLLRRTFPKGTVFVKNYEESICDGINKFFKNKESLKQEIIELKEEKLAVWNEEVNKIKYDIHAHR
jgi:glycosyltransferase involved in cell wall biosynthesis